MVEQETHYRLTEDQADDFLRAIVKAPYLSQGSLNRQLTSCGNNYRGVATIEFGLFRRVIISLSGKSSGRTNGKITYDVNLDIIPIGLSLPINAVDGIQETIDRTIGKNRLEAVAQ